MTEHVFLTGRKQVGKSTLIRKELERYKKENGEGKIGGFLTVRTDAVYDGKYSVHMLRAGEKCMPSEENLLFICGSADSSRSDERFNRMGSRILEESVRNGADWDQTSQAQLSSRKPCCALWTVISPFSASCRRQIPCFSRRLPLIRRCG